MSVSQEICEYFSDLTKPSRNVRDPGVPGTQAFYSSRVECTDKKYWGKWNVLSIIVKFLSSKSYKGVYNDSQEVLSMVKRNKIGII